MALHDYAELDEEDFYGQGFEKEGVVSVWVGQSGASTEPDEVDVLQDLCGVGYYDIDNQEGNSKGFELVPLKDLLADLSYVSSFGDSVLKSAAKTGVQSARWVLLQYDFAYDPRRVKRRIHEDPKFLGIFPYSAE